MENRKKKLKELETSIEKYRAQEIFNSKVVTDRIFANMSEKVWEFATAEGCESAHISEEEVEIIKEIFFSFISGSAPPDWMEGVHREATKRAGVCFDCGELERDCQCCICGFPKIDCQCK